MVQKYIKDLFNNCSVGNLLGIEIVDVKEGKAKAKLTLKKEHLNVFGIAHGGIIFTFADHVGGACGNSLGRKAILVESTIHYARAVKDGDTLLGEAKLTYQGNKTGRIDIHITKNNGDSVAFMHMLFFFMENDHKTETA